MDEEDRQVWFDERLSIIMVEGGLPQMEAIVIALECLEEYEKEVSDRS